MDRFKRTADLIGQDALEKLKKAKIALFGVGGVGSYVLEALTRSGVGRIDIFDKDTVDITNINRQIIALCDTVGLNKADVAVTRAKQINPKIDARAKVMFYLPENSQNVNLSEYDYIIDAIDTVTAKIELIVNADKANTPIISSMGTGNKLDNTAFKLADIYSTKVCPLARVLRNELKKRGIEKLCVLYSEEKPCAFNENSDKRLPPASISYVPATAGLIIAGKVIRDIIEK